MTMTKWGRVRTDAWTREVIVEANNVRYWLDMLESAVKAGNRDKALRAARDAVLDAQELADTVGRRYGRAQRYGGREDEEEEEE